MKNYHLLLPFVWIVFTTPSEANDQILIEIDIFQIESDISGEMSLTDYVWPSKREEEKAKEDKLTLFTLAKLKLHDYELVLDVHKWDPDQSGFTITKSLASPRFLVQPGQEFSMSIGADEKTEYFEAREDGLYELKTLPDEIGLTIKGQVNILTPERVSLENLVFQSRTITGREELIGSQSGQFGKPIVEESNLSTSLSLKFETNYGILFSSKSQGALLIRLRLENRNPG